MNIDEILSYPKLQKDDSFAFGCEGCGKCCRNREDIILTPLDLFKIAKHLGITIGDVISNYCVYYEGQTSKIPIVKINPREYRKTCPFNNKGRCIIHNVKPCVCALYPLGRATEHQTKEYFYFLQPVKCGNKRQTVREWLSEFDIEKEEKLSILWHTYLMEICTIIQKEESLLKDIKKFLFGVLFTLLYTEYDLNEEFSPQFTKNCDKILDILKTFKEKLENS